MPNADLGDRWPWHFLALLTHSLTHSLQDWGGLCWIPLVHMPVRQQMNYQGHCATSFQVSLARSPHLVGSSEICTFNRVVEIVASTANSVQFDIAPGVRQKCVRSPRVFCTLAVTWLGTVQVAGAMQGCWLRLSNRVFPHWACDFLALSVFLEQTNEEIGQVSSGVSISKRDNCSNLGTRPCTQMVW